MSLQTKVLKLTWYSFIYLFVTIAVIAAVVLTVARLWLPTAQNYKDDIESWVGGVLEQQVIISNLDADWYGFEPQLVLEQVQFLSQDGKSIISAFERVKVGFDLFESILRQAPVPGTLVIEGARIVLVRQLDGSFSVSGFGSPDNTDQQNEKTNRMLEEWLLDQRLLKIENSSLVWRDKKNKDEARLFSDVNIALRNQGSRHQIEGSVFLPQDLGSHVLFFMDLRGDVFSSNDWSGSAQVTGVGLELVNWLNETSFQDLQLVNGVVSFSSWARFRSSKLEDLRGELLASNIQLRSKKSRRLNKIDSISSDFSVAISSNDWRVTADEFSLVHRGKSWPIFRLDAHVLPEQNTYKVELSRLNIEHVVSLANISDKLTRQIGDYLRVARPHGQVHDLSIFLRQQEKSDLSYAMGGRFQNVSMQASKSMPGFNNLSGHFEWSNSDGHIQLSSQNWSIDYKAMFKRIRAFSRLSGRLFWEKQDKGWRLSGSNMLVADEWATGVGRFSVDVAEGKAPFLDLSFGLKGTKLNTVKKYLPDTLMSKNLVSWIESAVVNTTVAGGGLMYYGYVDEYPFKEGQGKFALDLALKDADLRFLEDWPMIEGIAGNLEISSLGLSFASTSGHVKNNRLENVAVTIPDFAADDVALSIDGNIIGPTNEKFQYMFDSPLDAMFAKNLRIFKAKGQSDLRLGLKIPLSDGPNDIKVDGKLAIKGNRLSSESISLDLQEINGELRFDTEGIYGDGIAARLGPFDLKAYIDTKEIGNGREIIFTQKGDLSSQQIAYIFERYVGQPQWKGFINGDTTAEVSLFIPMTENSFHKEITLQASSDLKGVGISLPYPLLKEPQDVVPFDIVTELSGNFRDMKIRLGETSSRMVFVSASDEISLDRGTVGFGIDADLPKENAFHFSGNLKRFFWREWEPLLLPEEGQSGLMQGGGGATSVYIDVAVDEVEILDAVFSEVNVQASNTVQGWAIHAKAPDLQGSVYMPLVWTTAPLVFDMKKIHVSRPPSESEEATINPADLPQIRFNAEDFQYNKIKFGKTEFESDRLADGFSLKHFKSSSKIADISSSGTWTLNGEEHKSRFKIEMQAKNFGKAMEQFGLIETLKQGNGVLIVDAGWVGAPVDFAFETLKGKMEVNMQNVRLTDLNIGPAKMLGLLSLESIPRRLFFDFRDVVQKGMVFDSVIGQFDVQNGDAFTSGIVLTGPTARMGLAGRVGLQARDFDLVITFIPKTLETLPVIGGIASTVGAAQPVLGAGLYVVQKILQPQVDELSAVQYTVAGNWQTPIVTEVKASTQAPAETEFVDEQ